MLWKLGELGEEGGLAIKKEIAAYAGVQCLCAELAGLPSVVNGYKGGFEPDQRISGLCPAMIKAAII